jgi:hypothetical protein
MSATTRAYLDALNVASFITLIVGSIVLAVSLDPLCAAWLGTSAGLAVFAVDLGAGAEGVTV